MRSTKRQATLLLTALLLGSSVLLPLSLPATPMPMAHTAHAQAPGQDENATVDPVREKKVDSIADKLMCQCGCGLTVFNCGHAMSCTIAPQMREQIGRMLDEGKSTGDILDYFVGIYGEKVLAAPKKSGFGLSAWITPFAGMGAGVVLLGILLYSWGRRRPGKGLAAAAVEGGEPPAEPGVDLSSYRARVERDLEELDRE